MHLFWLLPHVTGTPPWLLRPLRISASSELYLTLASLILFFECLGIQFFNSLTFYLADTMSCRGSLTLIPRKVEGFLGVTIISGICPCSHTQLDCNQFIITSRFVFIHVKTFKYFAYGENINKKIVAVTVFSIRKNIRQQPY